jgi:hypothetical protein
MASFAKTQTWQTTASVEPPIYAPITNYDNKGVDQVRMCPQIHSKYTQTKNAFLERLEEPNIISQGGPTRGSNTLHTVYLLCVTSAFRGDEKWRAGKGSKMEDNLKI